MASSSSIFNELYCPICLELIKDTFMTKCGHSFCYDCISNSMKNNLNKKCPKCRCILDDGERDIFPNFSLNAFIKNYKKELDKQELLKKLNESDEKLNFSSSASTSSLSQSSSSSSSSSLILKHDLKSPTAGLKSFMISECQHLSIPDINLIIDLLSKQKTKRISESISFQNQLLFDFLNTLLERKHEQIIQLNKEIQLIYTDLNDVKETLSKINNIELETSSSNSSNSNKKDVYQLLRRRMLGNYNDLVQCYFSNRIQDIHLTKTSQDPQTEMSLNKFREHLVKFNRFISVKTLATIDYCPNTFNNSKIVTSIQFDKDNDFVAISGITKNIKIYDYNLIVNNELIDVHYPSLEIATNSKISSLSWNCYQKNILASCDYEGIVAVWDANNGTKTKMFEEHEKRCWSVDFNEVDTRLLASGSDDCRVKIWTLNVDHSIATIDLNTNVCCVKFHPTNSYHIIFGSVDHCVHYYDLRNLKVELMKFKGHLKTVSYVKFLNNDKIISAATDNQLKLWNINNSTCLQTYTGHLNQKNFVGLDTDGEYIACGSENNSVYIYYNGVSNPMFNYAIDSNRTFGNTSLELKRNDTYEFVSAVCWRKHSNVILAANSLGVIEVLKLV